MQFLDRPISRSRARVHTTYKGRRQLRSATSRTCIVRRTFNNYGDRCFAAAGPKLWNSLPADLRQADISFQRFKLLLKTFLFSVLTNCQSRASYVFLLTFSYLLTLAKSFIGRQNNSHLIYTNYFVLPIQTTRYFLHLAYVLFTSILGGGVSKFRNAV